jgi:zinc transport system permease protein
MPWPISALPYPFELEFMRRALVAGIAVGVFAPMIGTFLVQKRMSLIGDGIGHVAFAGVGAGLIAGIWPIWTALAFAVAGALGVVLVSLGGGLNASLLTYLFGQPLTVNDSELVVILTLGVVIVASMLALRRVLFAVVTDEDWSRVSGLPVGFVNNVLAVLTAVAVVAAMRIVGILLIAAMMVLPVASGQILARSFGSTLRWSVAVSVGSVIAGLAVSRIWGTAPGGTIVLIAAAVFAVVSVARRSVVSRLPATESADL